MQNQESYDNFISQTACLLFIVYRKDTTPLLMLPHKRDHKGFSRFIKNFKKLVGRLPDADSQAGPLKSVIMNWGDAFYFARFLSPEVSVIAAFPQEATLGLTLTRFDKICEVVSADFVAES